MDRSPVIYGHEVKYERLSDKEIGEGTSSKVYLVRHVASGTLYAAKVFVNLDFFEMAKKEAMHLKQFGN